MIVFKFVSDVENVNCNFYERLLADLFGFGLVFGRIFPSCLWEYWFNNIDVRIKNVGVDIDIGIDFGIKPFL